RLRPERGAGPTGRGRGPGRSNERPGPFVFPGGASFPGHPRPRTPSSAQPATLPCIARGSRVVVALIARPIRHPTAPPWNVFGKRPGAGRGGERPRQYRECTRANGPPVRTGGLRSPRRRPPPGSPRTPGTAATTASATGTPSDPHAGGDRTGRRIGAAPTAELAPIVRRHGSRGSRNEERGHGGRERTSSGTRRVDPPWRSGAVHRAALGGDAVQGGRRIPRGGGAGGVDRRGGSGRLRRAPSAPRSGGTGGGARAGAL